MKNRLRGFICLAVCLSGPQLHAETIAWFSDADQSNLGASGVPMDAGFQFELGVFSGGFVPTSLNVGQWSVHWVVADSTTYNPTTRRFADQVMVANNNAPFLPGANAWIFGHRVTPTGTDRILLRALGWKWPAPDPMNPIATEWNVKDAGVLVLGSVSGSGSPFLMKSAVERNFTQWQTEHLAGEPLNGPGDDPDKDGVSNLLEFVFGTQPKTAGASTATPMSLVDGKLQVSIPRRIDHPAALTVQVSGDLTSWASGPGHTEIVADDVSSLVVRDLTPIDPANPKRFMRLKAEPAEP